jgi:hypothetical protein
MNADAASRWDSRHMIPRTAFWLGYLGYLLHFVGCSLGEDDWQPYEEQVSK